MFYTKRKTYEISLQEKNPRRLKTTSILSQNYPKKKFQKMSILNL